MLNCTIPKKIICFGDSNTYGYNSSNHSRFTEAERWTCLLQKYLGSPYYVIEEGLSGRTTAFCDPLFEGLNGLDYIFPCLLSHGPLDLLIIMIGTNDTKERFSATPENIAKGLERLTQKAISAADAWANKPNILILAPLPIEPGYKTTDVFGEMGQNCAEKSQALAPLYKQTAQMLGCHFLDTASIKGMEMYPYDYMHLSLESHKLLAEKLAKIIPDLINEKKGE